MAERALGLETQAQAIVRLRAWGSELLGLDLTFHSAYSAAFGKLGVWFCLLFFLFSSKKGLGN